MGLEVGPMTMGGGSVVVRGSLGNGSCGDGGGPLAMKGGP